MKRNELESKLIELQETTKNLSKDLDALIADALQSYKEQTGKNVIEWNWGEEDAPACTYTDFGDDLADCYITRIEFDDDNHITCIELYAYYQQETIEDAKLVYMRDYKRDLANAIIAGLD